VKGWRPVLVMKTTLPLLPDRSPGNAIHIARFSWASVARHTVAAQSRFPSRDREGAVELCAKPRIIDRPERRLNFCANPDGANRSLALRAKTEKKSK